MSKLIQSMSNTTRTENDAVTLKSSLNNCLDLFYKIGASRIKRKIFDLTDSYKKSFSESVDITIRVLLNARDCRGGKGERTLSIEGIKYAINSGTIERSLYKRVLSKFIDLGRYKDLIEFFDTAAKLEALQLFAEGLDSGNGLAFKWAPRLGKKGSKDLREFLGKSEQEYRKFLSNSTRVVETQMCENNWGEINYEHVPSVAGKRYSNAFSRHDNKRYELYKDGLVRGTASIKAKVLTPYDVIQSLHKIDKKVSQALWDELPDYIESSKERMLPLVDVSGSMAGIPMEVAISLGLYISERNEGVFKNNIITFTEKPRMFQLSEKDLIARYFEIKAAPWGQNTDIGAVFDLILRSAVKYKIEEKDMPSILLILSDMQFDRACRPNKTIFESIKKDYKKSGYSMPKIVFWNLRNSIGVPVFDKQFNAALVSGYSPSIMKSILSNKIETFTPENVMLEEIMNERYNY